MIFLSTIIGCKKKFPPLEDYNVSISRCKQLFLFRGGRRIVSVLHGKKIIMSSLQHDCLNLALGNGSADLDASEFGQLFRERLFLHHKKGNRPRVVVLDGESGLEVFFENTSSRSWNPNQTDAAASSLKKRTADAYYVIRFHGQSESHENPKLRDWNQNANTP